MNEAFFVLLPAGGTGDGGVETKQKRGKRRKNKRDPPRDYVKKATNLRETKEEQALDPHRHPSVTLQIRSKRSRSRRTQPPCRDSGAASKPSPPGPVLGERDASKCFPPIPSIRYGKITSLTPNTHTHTQATPASIFPTAKSLASKLNQP